MGFHAQLLLEIREAFTQVNSFYLKFSKNHARLFKAEPGDVCDKARWGRIQK